MPSNSGKGCRTLKTLLTELVSLKMNLRLTVCCTRLTTMQDFFHAVQISTVAQYKLIFQNRDPDRTHQLKYWSIAVLVLTVLPTRKAAVAPKVEPIESLAKPTVKPKRYPPPS